MNSRERLLAAFNHWIHDRIPWSGLITDYFINSYKNKYGETNPADFLKGVGADVVNRVGMKAKSKGVVVQTFANNILIDTDKSGDSVPSGAKLENIKAISQLIEAYGKY